ncbi:hypothetical protein QKW35_05595 [Pontibacterium granulatum]|uniref:hypothetical protein n=1 Tax=Pontibacterium granulatum TaxID=2036029 RepID=UPI00249A4AF0|nr:hypothetical protein [Pontibacterium granulatum]MDI3323841.1 hypothetical protein [Pontibacterium granulatum]
MENKLIEFNEALETFEKIVEVEKEIKLNNNLKPARDFVQKSAVEKIEIEEKSTIIQFLSFIKIETAYDFKRLEKDKDLEKFILEEPNWIENKNDYNKFMESIISRLLRVQSL